MEKIIRRFDNVLKDLQPSGELNSLCKMMVEEALKGEVVGFWEDNPLGLPIVGGATSEHFRGENGRWADNIALLSPEDARTELSVWRTGRNGSMKALQSELEGRCYWTHLYKKSAYPVFVDTYLGNRYADFNTDYFAVVNKLANGLRVLEPRDFPEYLLDSEYSEGNVTYRELFGF